MNEEIITVKFSNGKLIVVNEDNGEVHEFYISGHEPEIVNEWAIEKITPIIDLWLRHRS